MSGTSRPRHQDKDYEKLIKKAEARGWVAEKKRRHWQLYCPCPDEHIRTISATPSTRGTLQKVQQQLAKCSNTESDST